MGLFGLEQPCSIPVLFCWLSPVSSQVPRVWPHAGPRSCPMQGERACSPVCHSASTPSWLARLCSTFCSQTSPWAGKNKRDVLNAAQVSPLPSLGAKEVLSPKRMEPSHAVGLLPARCVGWSDGKSLGSCRCPTGFWETAPAGDTSWALGDSLG